MVTDGFLAMFDQGKNGQTSQAGENSSTGDDASWMTRLDNDLIGHQSGAQWPLLVMNGVITQWPSKWVTGVITPYLVES